MGSIGWGCQDAAKPETDGLDLYSRGALNGAGRHQMLSAAIFFWDKTRCCHRRANDEPQPSELFFDLLSTRCQFVESCSLAAWELRTHSSGMSAKLFGVIRSNRPNRCVTITETRSRFLVIWTHWFRPATSSIWKLRRLILAFRYRV